MSQLIGLRRLRAEFLPDLSERWLYELARRGQIPACRVGTRWLFDGEAVVAAIRAGTSRGAAADGQSKP